MSLQNLLAENKIKIVNAWIDMVMATYSPDGARFFKSQKDRFANPLGYSVEKGLEKMFEDLCTGAAIDELPSELFQFLKLRAVQDMSPSQAVAFLYQLKEVVANVCGVKKLRENAEEWHEFDRTIDGLALQCFDVYMQNRELLSQVKIQEYKRGNSIMLESGLRCPSSVMRGNKEAKKELQVIQDC